MSEKKNAGKVAVVTGSGTGIGMGVAMEFARAGYDVVFHYAHHGETAEAAVKECQAMGVQATAIKGDFNNIDEVFAFADKAVAFRGHVDVLVNNAGITMNRPFLEASPQQFDTLFNVNIKAMYFATQRIAASMVPRRSGVILNVSSVHAFAGYVEHSIYAPTKAAIVAFTRVLGIELGIHGVRVNCLAPGWVLVENQLVELEKQGFDREKASLILPSGFIADPPEMGRIAVCLASDDCRYIVGQTIVADGGQLAILPNTGDFREKQNIQWGKNYVSGL